MDRVAVHLDVLIFERDLDATSYVEQAALLRRGSALLAPDDSGRRQALEELAALNDFLAEKFPRLREEWRARRASLRGIEAEEVPES